MRSVGLVPKVICSTKEQIKQTAMQHDVLFKVIVSYIFFQEWYDREERRTHLSRDTSSMAENKTKIYRKNARISGLIRSIHFSSISNFLRFQFENDKLSKVRKRQAF